MKRTLWCVAALLLFAASRSNAMTMNYPDLDGVNVMYIDISESTEEPVFLFGAPDISGDTMDFDPTDFKAEVNSTTGTNNSDIVDGQLNFTIMRKGDFALTEVIIRERGDYALVGLGNAAATASVTANFGYSIIEVDGASVNPIDGDGNLVFSPSNGSYALPMTGSGWNGIATIDIAGHLAAAGINGVATKVEFFLDNTLRVAAADGGTAFIAKKDAGVSITVPEPSSLAILLVGGLLGLAQVRRWRA